MLPEVLQTGKANPYLEYVEMQEVFIQNEWVLFQDGKSSMYSTCHQVAGRPPEGMVLYVGVSFGLSCHS